MEQKIIIAIVGPSGSGKTTLGRHICRELGYNWISSYTTRPMREGETDSIEHIFVSKDAVPDKNTMIAHTVFGGYDYWTTQEQFTDNVPNVYVIDEDGLIEMERIISERGYNKFKVIKVYVERDNINVDEERMLRDKGRHTLPSDYYDVILTNDGTLEEFLSISTRIINDI